MSAVPEDFSSIPQCLRDRRQWVCWRKEMRSADKPTKVPYMPSGASASHAKDDTWSTFDECAAAAGRSDSKFDGIGFVFSESDPYAGVDLDGCFTADGTLKAWAVEIVTEAQANDCYIERTPSGLGLHIIGRSTVGKGRKAKFNDGGVEMYDRLRYFTMTGEEISVGSPDGDATTVIGMIARRFVGAGDEEQFAAQEGVEIPDYQADALAAEVTKGASLDFMQFWHDKVSVKEHGPDRSAHRMSLLNRLAMKLWSVLHREPTKQELQAVALRAPFIRNEADKRRGKWPRLAASECATAIKWARDHMVEDEVLESVRSKLENGFVLAADFAAGAAQPDYVIDGVLRRGYLYALTGMSNAGKTSIAISMARCVNAGTPFGTAECARGRVLILAGENPDDVAYRFVAEADHALVSVAEVFPSTVVLPYGFAIEAGLPFIQEQARAIGGYALVVVDSKTSYFGGDSEDDNAQAYRHAAFLRQLTTIEGRPATLVLSHPVKRPEGPDQLAPRGGSAFLNELDGNLTVWRTGGSETVRLSHTKIRGMPFDPIDIRIQVVELQKVRTSAGKPVTSVLALPTTAEDAEKSIDRSASDELALIGAMLKAPAKSMRKRAEACGWINAKGNVETGRLGRAVARLEKHGLIEEYMSGKYKVTAKGKRAAEDALGDGMLARRDGLDGDAGQPE